MGEIVEFGRHKFKQEETVEITLDDAMGNLMDQIRKIGKERWRRSF